jgi:hypothetical protein
MPIPMSFNLSKSNLPSKTLIKCHKATAAVRTEHSIKPQPQPPKPHHRYHDQHHGLLDSLDSLDSLDLDSSLVLHLCSLKEMLTATTALPYTLSYYFVPSTYMLAYH